MDICKVLYYLSNLAPFMAQALEVPKAQSKSTRQVALCIFKHLSTPRYTLGWSNKKEQILLITILIKNTSDHYLKLIYIKWNVIHAVWLVWDLIENLWPFENSMQRYHSWTIQSRCHKFTCSSYLFSVWPPFDCTKLQLVWSLCVNNWLRLCWC